MMAKEILDEIKPKRFVMAHMGGWEMWSEVKECLLGREIFIDTAFSAVDFAYQEETPFEIRKPTLSEKEFTEMVLSHGADKVLFGTDSPWGDQKPQIDFIRGLSISEEDKAAILGGNAEKLLF